jgi:hypothetical protein
MPYKMIDPRLTIYTMTVKPTRRTTEYSNRNLFKHIIGQPNAELEDSFIVAEVFRRFIAMLDTPEMFSDAKTRKCITANQVNVEDEATNTNIVLYSEQRIIDGTLEGGPYGRIRNKTSIRDKTNKSPVSAADAITDNFYFFLYLPPESNKMVLMIQSYSDESIDGVMKTFFERFFRVNNVFNKPKIQRYVPMSIIDDFKRASTVSMLSFTTEVPSQTLLDNPLAINNQHYKISVKITPSDEPLSVDEFNAARAPMLNSIFGGTALSRFAKRTGFLMDNETQKTSPFELDSSFNIQPVILLSKYIVFEENESDFQKIRDYCFGLMNSFRDTLYPVNAVQER